MSLVVRWQPEPDEGWIPVLAGFQGYPPRDRIVEYHSVWSVSPYFARWCDFDPCMNVTGLYWRDP